MSSNNHRTTRPRAHGALLVTILLATSTSACSWALVRGPDEATPITQPVSCTTSAAAPLVDLGLMLGTLVTGGVMTATGEPVVAIGLTSWSLLHALSLNSGMKRIDRCNKAKALREPPPVGPHAPQPYPPPPYPYPQPYPQLVP